MYTEQQVAVGPVGAIVGVAHGYQLHFQPVGRTAMEAVDTDLKTHRPTNAMTYPGRIYGFTV